MHERLNTNSRQQNKTRYQVLLNYYNS